MLTEIYRQFIRRRKKTNNLDMPWEWFINLFLLLAVFSSCLTQQTADTLANSKTKQILAYIAGLPQQGIFYKINLNLKYSFGFLFKGNFFRVNLLVLILIHLILV